MLPSEQRNSASLPVRNAVHSPVPSRDRPSRYGNMRWTDSADAHADRDKPSGDRSGEKVRYAEHHDAASQGGDSPNLASPTPRRDFYGQHGTSRSYYNGKSNGAYTNSNDNDFTVPRLPTGPPTDATAAGEKLAWHRSDSGVPLVLEKAKAKNGLSSSAAELRGRLLGRGVVDRGLAGVGDSWRLSTTSSVWALPPPPPPAGQAVPALLSHLAELRSLCQRQRESGRSLRRALVRKQGEMNETAAEASWLRAELGFIVGDMLGALQEKPTAATIFGALSERIRADLGAEAAAVYIHVGDDKLWLLPQESTDGRNYHGVGSALREVFVQRGVGVVGLVAMGAVPGATKSQQHAGGNEVGSGGGDDVEVLLLNDGLEAFDNGTTVEAALVRAARGLPQEEGGGSTIGGVGSVGGTVRNMLLARVGPGMTAGALTGATGAGPHLPGPPTAVIQALNKQVAPDRFTEGDARTVRSLAPAVAAGSRLILSLLNRTRESTTAGGVCPREPPTLPDEHLLSAGLRRAREELGATRARVFMLNAEIAPSQFRLWLEDPPPLRSQRLASTFSARIRNGDFGTDGGVRMAADSGLEGLALATGRPVRSTDVLSDPLCDREMDLQEGFLTRSVLCAPLFLRSRGGCGDGGPPLGVLQLAIGRGKVSEEGVFRGGLAGSAGDMGGERRENERKKFFTEEDEEVVETHAKEIAGMLSDLLDAGLRPSASVTTLAGGAGHVGADAWTGEGNCASAPRPHGYRRVDKLERTAEGVGGSSGIDPSSCVNEIAPPSQSPPSTPPRHSAQGLATRPDSREQTGLKSRDPGDDNGGGRGNSADVALPWRASRGRTPAEEVRKAQEGALGKSLACSGASTAELSPPGAEVRASVATAAVTSPADSPPPASPATDGSNSVSPCVQDGGNVAVSTLVDGQESAPAAEAIQADSWATALRVLEACKESLAAERRLPRVGTTSLSGAVSCDSVGPFSLRTAAAAMTAMNVERLAPATCSLVSSLLPGCSAVLLLVDSESGRLRHADTDYGRRRGDGTPVSPRLVPIRQEGVARRALASGKAMLAQAGQKQDRDGKLPGGQGAAGNTNPRGGGGDRVFCVPVVGSSGQTFGVLQLFLPPCPVGVGASTSRDRSGQNWQVALQSPSPPPPSFFMATKIIADCVGLALSWCEVVDREEKDRAADRAAAVAAFAAAEKSTAEAFERRQIDLMAKYERSAQDAAGSFARQIADTTNAHTLLVASLLEGREALAASAAEAAARVRQRQETSRVLAAWRGTVKRLQKSERNVNRMMKSRSAAAFRRWRQCSMIAATRRNVEIRGAAAMEKRGLRRAIGFWARDAARARYTEELRLMGVRRLVEIWRERGSTRRWQAAIRCAASAKDASARKDADASAREMLSAKEIIAKEQARAQALAVRVAEIFERKRRDRAMRSACQAWLKTVRRRRRCRDAVEGSSLWRRRRDVLSSLMRWRDASTPRISLGELDTPRVVGYTRATTAGSTETSLLPGGGRVGSGYNLASTAVADTKTLAYSSVRTRLHETQVRLSRVMETQRNRRTASTFFSAWRRQTAMRREGKAALSRVLRNLFRRRSLARALVAWRVKAATPLASDDTDRNKALLDETRTRALSRVVRRDQRRVLNRRFRVWRQVARAAAAAADEQAAWRSAVEAKRKQAAAAAAASAAVENATHARGEELKRLRDAAADLQQMENVLREEVAASVAREQAMDKHLQLERERTSILSLAAARAFREGRDRLKMTRALARLRDAARARRLSAIATARISSLRRSRCIRMWNEHVRHAEHHRASAATALVFAAGASKRVISQRARAALRTWAARTASRRRRQHGAADVGEKLRGTRLRVAVQAWREVSHVHAMLTATERRGAAHLAQWNARRALGRWRLASFGDTRTATGGGGGGRVLARLFTVAARYDDAALRRRARVLLQNWVGRVEKRKRLRVAKMCFDRATRRRSEAAALRRWQSLTLVHRNIRLSLESGATFAALQRLGRGLLLWRHTAQLAAPRHTAAGAVETTTATATTTPSPANMLNRVSNAHERPDPADTRRPVEAHRPSPHEARVAVPNPRSEAGFISAQHSARNFRASSLNPSFGPQPSDDAIESASVTQEAEARLERSTSGLLDLLVETCAAPPSYTLGSGLAALGSEACSAAVHTFGLFSASLFEVTGGQHGTAERVAVVRLGDRGSRASSGKEAVEDSAMAELAEWGHAGRQPLGDGAVGVAARSARPVCVEIVEPVGKRDATPWDEQKTSGLKRPFEEESHGRTGSVITKVAGASVSTVLCIPLMLQAVPLQTASAALGRDENGAPKSSGSVEVVGVLRAVRAGSGSFAGDDARALSAFCGQLALVVMAEHVLSQVRAVAAAEKSKETRALRRQACRKVLGLFAEGGLAEELLHGKRKGDAAAAAATAAEAAPQGAGATAEKRRDSGCSALHQQLWGSVARLAAEALGCESVDLLRVASLVPRTLGGSDGGSDAARLADWLYRRRSFRRHPSHGAHAIPSVADASNCASGSTFGSKCRQMEDEEGNWLCSPVLGTGVTADVGRGTVEVACRGGEVQNGDGEALVCIAVNKERGRSFDDVDEVLLKTITALYGVASSWMKLPATGAADETSTSPAQPRQRRDAGAISYTVQAFRGSARLSTWGQGNRGSSKTTGATANRKAGETRAASVNKANKAEVNALNDTVSLGGTGVSAMPVGRASGTSTVLPQRSASIHATNARATSNDSGSQDPLNDRWRDITIKPQSGDAGRPSHVRNYARMDTEGPGERRGAALNATMNIATATHAQENTNLRKRADKAERMLEATRDRLCRALQDGALSAATTTAAAVAAAVAAAGGNPAAAAATDYDDSPNLHRKIRKARGRSIEELTPAALDPDGGVGRRNLNRRRFATTTPRYGRRRRDGDGVGSDQHARSLSCDTECSDLRSHVGGCYSSDGGVERRRARRSGLGSDSRGRKGEASRGRRRPSSATDMKTSRQRRGRSDADGQADGGCQTWRQERGPAELRSSKLARMPEELGRLRTATGQLEAKRARRSSRLTAQAQIGGGVQRGGRGQLSQPGGVVGVDVTGAVAAEGGFRGDLRVRSAQRIPEERSWSTDQDVYGHGGGGRVSAAVGGSSIVCDGRAVAEAEAAALMRENASLRKKLNGLVAIEELEGRAIRRGLLPLTGHGGSLPGGDFFPSPPVP